ncbi:phage head spike fiber domain-containing protein [Roseospira visakhapatnamensis]|uniref:Uncharacterized protein n=1 Tax=Roseospira visakhapatnamensis TaxID=390880 RepID=A0A7W6RDL2_9PROT|nr:hypothetical protein [Roseospira visakhapatnamensis]MBB4266101.1 hypothetical protein [Roseospira visakhapatnamensis]
MTTMIYPTLHLLARPDVMPSGLHVTRASEATRVNALGRVETVSAHVLRHDYAPDTGVYRGWLVEEARTNQVRFSQVLTQAPWLTGDATVTARAVLAPDGVSLAGTLTETAATAVHTLFQESLSFTAGQRYALSVFAKANGRERLQLVLPSTAFGVVQSAVFDLGGGSIGATEGDPAPTIEVFTDGWVRCALSATATGTALSPVHLRLRDTGAVSSYTGDGVSGAHLWGVQLEAGAAPSSLIATTTAPATRAADRLRMTLGAGDVHPHQGTLMARGAVPAGLAAPLVELSDGTADARMTLSVDAQAGSAAFTVVDGGATVAALSRDGVTGGAEVRAAAAYADDDVALALGGSALATDGDATVPTVTTLTLGGTASGAVGPRCWVRQVGVFPRRLGDGDLQSLSA